MFLPQAARWKAASYKEIASFEKHGVYNLILLIYNAILYNPILYNPILYNPGPSPSMVNPTIGQVNKIDMATCWGVFQHGLR